MIRFEDLVELLWQKHRQVIHEQHSYIGLRTNRLRVYLDHETYLEHKRHVNNLSGAINSVEMEFHKGDTLFGYPVFYVPSQGHPSFIIVDTKGAVV